MFILHHVSKLRRYTGLQRRSKSLYFSMMFLICLVLSACTTGKDNSAASSGNPTTPSLAENSTGTTDAASPKKDSDETKIGNTSTTTVLTPESKENPAMDDVEYLKTYAVPIAEVKHKDPEYTRFADYQIVLMGEVHGTVHSMTAEMELIRALHREGFRHLVFEFGPAELYLIDRYIASEQDDSSALTRALKLASKTMISSEESLAFFRELRAFIKSLPEEEKLILHTADLQHSGNIAAMVLQMIAGSEYRDRLNQCVQNEYADFLKQILEMNPEETENKEARGKVVTLHSLSIKYKEDAMKFWEKDYELVTDVLQKTSDAFDCRKDQDNFQVLRENKMKEYFVQEWNKAPNEKWMGIVGKYHADLLAAARGNDENTPSLAGYLDKEHPDTAGKIGAILFFYYNSHVKDTKDGTYRSVSLSDQFGINQYSKMMRDSEHEVLFCPLMLERSPFLSPGNLTLKSYQYIVLIKDSKATTPIKE